MPMPMFTVQQIKAALQGKKARDGGLDAVDLRKLAHVYGLASSGSRKTLESRIVDYLTERDLGDKVYNPFYDDMVAEYGVKNCSPTRDSIQSMSKESYRFVQKYCDVLQLDHIRYIVGPWVYTEYQLGEKRIHLFGEVHTVDGDYDKRNTVTFSSFLKSLLTQRNSILYDIYMELELDRDAQYLSFPMIQVLRDFYGSTVYNARLHHADYRRALYSYERERSPKHKSLAAVYHALFAGELDSTDPKWDKLLTLTMRAHLVGGFIKTNPKLQKQLALSGLQEEIMAFLRAELNGIVKAYEEEQPEERSAQADEFVSIDTIVMDAYLLGRMFRPFDGAPQNNVIVYAGMYHTDRYARFLESLGAHKVLEVTGDTSRLDISSIRHLSSLYGA